MPRGKFDSTNQKHYPDLVVTRHQYGISALVSQMSFGGETSDSIAKCRLFSQAIMRGCLTGKIWVFWISGPFVKLVFSLALPLTSANFSET